MRPNVETNFKYSNSKSVEAFGRTVGEHHPVLPQMLEPEIKSIDSCVYSSIPCTPTPLSTSRTCPATNFGTRSSLFVALIAATRGNTATVAMPHCRAVEEPVPHLPSSQRRSLPPSCPLTRPHLAQQGPNSAGVAPPVHAIHRQNAPEAVPHRRAPAARLHATRRAPP